MLIEFRVQNHRSLLEEQVLTMEAATIGDAGDSRPREVPGHEKPLLPAAALYGANASGKSNLLTAFASMREAVDLSHRVWNPDGGVPREPFAWGAGPQSPSVFEVVLLLGGVRYQYGFAADDRQFLEEWLYAWPKGRRQTWFERDGQSFKFGDQLRGENRVIEQLTRPNALFLSAAAQNKHEQLGIVHRWFVQSHLHGLRHFTVAGTRADSLLARWFDNTFGFSERRAAQQWLFEQDQDTDAEASRRATMLKDLLCAADTGIVDVRARKSDGPRRTRVELLHRGADPDSGWLDLHQESHGTITIFQLAPYVFDALLHGSVVFVDELESSLHPLLARQLVDLFNSPKANPCHAQLVFATHNTSLIGRVMGEPLLRRDQIWLTEKNPKGQTCIYPLTDYKPRKAENLERGYLQGRYGAIPLLGELIPDAPDVEDQVG